MNRNRIHIPKAAPRNLRLPSARGFTLIEVIAVLTLLSVASALIASSLVVRLKRSMRDSEAISMASLTDALRTRILRTQSIPSENDIPQALADELALPLNRIQSTLAGFNRVFLVDPDLRIGSPTSVVQSLPYTQGVRGTIEPVTPRVMILSSLAGTLPVTSPASTSTFTSLWSNTSGTIPSSWTTWKGQSDDLRFGRLDFRTLFHRVVLNNLDPVNTATYSIGSTTNSFGIAVGNRVETWFFAGSAVNLHLANLDLQAREFLRSDTSYVFENGRWSRDITYGTQPPLGVFGQLVEDFLSSPIPSDAKFGSNPQGVIEEFFTYLYSYGIWATGDPPDIASFETGGSSSEQQIPYYRILKDAQARMDSFTNNLID